MPGDTPALGTEGSKGPVEIHCMKALRQRYRDTNTTLIISGLFYGDDLILCSIFSTAACVFLVELGSFGSTPAPWEIVARVKLCLKSALLLFSLPARI
jgi:hypothetical protein